MAARTVGRVQLRRALAGGLAVLAASVALSACSDGDGDSGDNEGSGASSPGDPISASTAAPKIPVDGGYVALGDSYTAAPGVPTTETQSGCFRSDNNYPSQIAAAIDATSVADVSCSGASTLSLVGVQQSGTAVLPAQFDALSDDTALVTISIGANDLDLFFTVVDSCLQVAESDPTGSPCRDQLTAGGTDQLTEKIRQISDRVTAAVAGVLDRAPGAEVFVVGYPQPVPAEGTCPELPLAAGDYPYVRDTLTALDAALQKAAAQADATYVDMAAASEGHDICAGADAWVQGVEGDPDEAIALHPFEVEQQAVADLVLAQLQAG